MQLANEALSAPLIPFPVSTTAFLNLLPGLLQIPPTLPTHALAQNVPPPSAARTASLPVPRESILIQLGDMRCPTVLSTSFVTNIATIIQPAERQISFQP